jgi:hypothetical protein
MACLELGTDAAIAEWDAFAACFLDSGCTDEDCLLDVCGTEYFACTTGESTCSGMSDCNSMCPEGDEVCAMNCYVESTWLAQGQADDLQTCIEDNACTTPECIAENCNPQLQDCLGGMSDSLGCLLTADCMFNCGSTSACQQICFDLASSGAAGPAQTLFTCGEGDSCVDLTCAEASCPSEFSECSSGTGTCAEMSACIGACNQAPICETNCWELGEATAQAQFQDLAVCIEDNACVDQDCIDTNCSAEVSACGL